MTSSDVHRKRLLYISHHRGMREMDLILGNFARASVPVMTPDALLHFEQLLAFSDQELYGWLFEDKRVSNPHLQKLVEDILEHNRLSSPT